MDIHIGDIVGDYRVVEAIGAGGMGAVYKVEHRITKRVEAMKALSTGFGAAPSDVRRFEREIELQARLQHPNIAAVYSAVQHGNVLALVMEYVEGESLRRLLARGPLPLETVLRIAADLLAALDCAHRNGVVHGDVSPANIMITPAGAAKLTDFGLARDGGPERPSGAGVPVGTAWYMSPEQVRGEDAIDARTDIYAAGAVLHEMLTGKKLFAAETAFAIMRCHVETAPQPPSALNTGVPGALDAAVLRALAKEPAARFQSAAEFRDAIRHAGAARRARGRALLACGALAVAASFWAAVLRSNAPHTVSGAPVTSPPRPAAAVEVLPPQLFEARPEPAPPAVEPAAEDTQPVVLKPFTRRYAIETDRARTPAATPAYRPPAPPAPKAEHGATRVSAPADLPALPVVSRPAAVAAPAIPGQTVEAPKPEKSGNRFVRALGKINPFRRSEKSDAPDGK